MLRATPLATVTPQCCVPHPTPSQKTSQVVNTTLLQNYYQSAYAAVRNASASCYVWIAPQTFQQDSQPTASATPQSWQTFMSQPPYTKVLLDLHKCAAVQPCTFEGPKCLGPIGAAQLVDTTLCFVKNCSLLLAVSGLGVV